MIALSPLFWSTLVLAAVLGAVAVVLVLEIVRGHVAVRTRWGRRFHDLQDRTVEVEAPLDVVRDLLRAAARGQTPGLTKEERTTVVREEGGLILNESVTASAFGPVWAMEAVQVHEDRVTYLHVAGPLPGTEEEFTLSERGGATTVRYRGRIPVSFWGLGALVARWLVLPEYNRLMEVHMAALKASAESKAKARSRRAQRRPDDGGQASATTST